MKKYDNMEKLIESLDPAKSYEIKVAKLSVGKKKHALIAYVAEKE